MQIERLSSDDAGVNRASAILRAGGLVAFPTETVYGLGADALSAMAIESVFRAKGRPADNPLIVHISDQSQIDEFALRNDWSTALSEAFMPGPLTLVLPALDIIPSIARAGLPTVALRIPDHEVALRLIALAGPLVAPSANLSGRPSPTCAEHVIADLDGRIDAVLDGGPCRVGLESTVVDLSGEIPRVLRPGHITTEQIADLLGVMPEGAQADTRERPSSPGMKYRHYAPSIPVFRLESATENYEDIASELKRYLRQGVRTFFLVGPSLPELSHGLLEREVVAPLNDQTLYGSFRRAEIEGFDRVLLVYRGGEISAALENRIAKAVSRE